MKKEILKFCLTLLFILIFFLLVFGGDEDLLQIDVSLNPSRLSRGEEGRVILKLKVKEGILISPHPSFIIEFSSTPELIFPKNFFTATDLEIEVLEDKGEEYLNLSTPLEIPFTVNLEAKRGVHSLEGKVKYFASCRKEGWCLKKSAKFSISYFVRQTRVKKS